MIIPSVDYDTFIRHRPGIVNAMRCYGGGFVSALAVAISRADNDNARRIHAAFPHYIDQYGPDSPFFRRPD